MSQYAGSERARREQELRQRQFRERMQNPSHRASNKNYSSSSYLSFEFTEWHTRRIAPFAMVIHALTLLFLLSWFISTRTSAVLTENVTIGMNKMTKIVVPKAGEIYRFEILQYFPVGIAPLYSELEIEVIDENYDHVYSVYKDLWQESHPNGEGSNSVYKDVSLSFDLELPKAGTYYVHGISHNNNNGLVVVNAFKKLTGSIYFPFYSIIFGALSLILFLGSTQWGSPGMMYATLPKLRSWKENKAFKRFVGVVIVIFVGTWIIALTHYGYAKGGENKVLPTYFYKTHTVIYLG